MWLEKNGPLAAWSKLSGTTRFATVVGTAILVLFGAVVATRANANAQRSADATVAATPAVDDIPTTITREWCGRLGARLEPRLAAQAEAQYPGRGAAANVHDYVLNMVNNCLADVGKPVAPHWRCHWDETFDGAESCKAMEKSAKAEERRAEAATAPSSSAADPVVGTADATCACTVVHRWSKAREWLPTKVRTTINAEFLDMGCEPWTEADLPFSAIRRDDFARAAYALDKLVADVEALPGCADDKEARKRMLDTAREIQKARKLWERTLDKPSPSVAELNQANRATCALQTRLWKTLHESCGKTAVTGYSAKACGFGCPNW